MKKTAMLRVVACVCDGLYQRYCLTRLAQRGDLAGVVLYAPLHTKEPLVKRVSRYANPIRLYRHLQARVLMRGYAAKARPTLERLFCEGGHAPELPKGIPIVRVDNVNSPDAVALVTHLSPDLVCVNGTNLLRAPMLEMIPRISHGIINLHTGLSPYSRGGNCDLFMLLEGRPEMVGVTIHHIDAGIDSGDIIITARPELDLDDNFEIIEAKCFRLGIDLMLVAIEQIADANAERVKQWEPGKLFLRRTGYAYEPRHRVLVNRMLERGLIRDYLARRNSRDQGIRLIGRQS